MPTAKEIAKELVEKLPDDVTIDDIMYELYVKEKILSSMEKIEKGEGISHQNARDKLKKWLV